MLKGKFRLRKIEKIERKRKEDKSDVYDLSIDINHSYIANGFVVHNCITSTQARVHFPMASLIQETVEVKKKYEGKCKIVADGGIRDYGDVVVALALGADCVMIGSVFSGLEGTPGEVTTDGYKKFYGMASREGQIDMKGEKTHTAEGTVKLVKVTGTIPGWVCNMKDYLRSAMSYCGARTLSEFKPEIVILSEGTKQTINR